MVRPPLISDAEADTLVQVVLRSKTLPTGLMTPQQMADYITDLPRPKGREIAWEQASRYVYRSLKKQIIAADPDAWCLAIGPGRIVRNVMKAAVACASVARSADTVNRSAPQWHRHNPEHFFMPEADLRKMFDGDEARRRCRLRQCINVLRSRNQGSPL
jgi:hypothetical protein